MTIKLSDYKAVTFDCYGTLVDWDTGVSNFLGPWAVEHAIEASCSDMVKEFAKAQNRHQQFRPIKNYRSVIREAFADVANMHNIRPSTTELDAFSASVGTWPAFPDTIDALRALKRQGLHLGVVSNVDNASFEETHMLLGGLIDTVITAEMAGAYKPGLEMFTALFAALANKGIAKHEILHVAQSRFHDVAPGNKIGLDVVWIDRRYGRPGNGITIASDAEPKLRLTNLAELCRFCCDHAA